MGKTKPSSPIITSASEASYHFSPLRSEEPIPVSPLQIEEPVPVPSTSPTSPSLGPTSPSDRPTCSLYSPASPSISPTSPSIHQNLTGNQRHWFFQPGFNKRVSIIFEITTDTLDRMIYHVQGLTKAQVKIFESLFDQMRADFPDLPLGGLIDLLNPKLMPSFQNPEQVGPDFWKERLLSKEEFDNLRSFFKSKEEEHYFFTRLPKFYKCLDGEKLNDCKFKTYAQYFCSL